MSPVLTITRRELTERREEILARLGLTLDAYIERSQRNELSGLEWDVREDLDSIAFLLGEDSRID